MTFVPFALLIALIIPLLPHSAGWNLIVDALFLTAMLFCAFGVIDLWRNWK